MNENQLDSNQKCYIDWEKLNREFDELRQNEVEVAKRKTVQKLIRKAEERVRAEEQLKLIEEKEKSKEEGIEQGIEQGIIFIARRMIAANKDEIEISNTTGLTIDKIRELKSGDKHE